MFSGKPTLGQRPDAKRVATVNQIEIEPIGDLFHQCETNVLFYHCSSF